jgi:hypothetical protein
LSSGKIQTAGLPHYMRAVFEKNDFNLMGMIFDSKKQLLT